MCSYTSSVTTTRSWRTASAATCSSSARVKTLQAGLLGELSTTSRVFGDDRGLERRRVEPELRRHEPHHARLGLGHRDPGQVGVVERLEHDGLVARVEQRRDRRAERLGGPGVDRDLARRVVGQAVEALLVIGHRLLQRRQAGHRRVLVVARAQGLDRGLLDEVGAVEVREALAEIDGVVAAGERRHLGEDGGAEAVERRVRRGRWCMRWGSVPRPSAVGAAGHRQRPRLWAIVSAADRIP